MTAAAAYEDVTGLVRRYGERWEIRHPHSGVWTAERAEGHAIRFIVAESASALAAKLEAAEQEERS